MLLSAFTDVERAVKVIKQFGLNHEDRKEQNRTTLFFSNPCSFHYTLMRVSLVNLSVRWVMVLQQVYPSE